MQAAAITSRFLTGCSSKAVIADSENVVSNDGLLRHTVAKCLIQTVSSKELFLKLTTTLIQFAEEAYLRRDLDALEEASRVLMNLPVEAAGQIGLYYHALSVKRKGDLEEAQRLLETVADNAPPKYRAQAIQSLGANYHDKGRLDDALRFQLEALRMASGKPHGLQTTLLAQGEIAIVRGLTGDHHGALAVLKKLWPLVYHVGKQTPFYFYVFHNELAVELGEVGRVEEAKAASEIALACPFASAYPEWSETRQELEAKRTSATPSIVAFSCITEPEPSPQIEPQRQRVAAISLVPERESKPEPSPLIEPQRQPEPSRALNLIRATKAAKTARTASNNVSFQRSVTPFPAKATSAFKAVSILDQVLDCIGPRAPPRPH